MTLIKSISGIRGTIGGKPGDGFSPLDIVKFTSAYAEWLKRKNEGSLSVVVGRDARISGTMVESLVISTLTGMGVDVINLGLSTTPTVEIAVPLENANGGIIITASHNPKQWNALKLLNGKGEFISGEDGNDLLKIADNEDFTYSNVDNLGKTIEKDNYFDIHIQEIIKHELVDIRAIKASNFKVAIDAVNSTGGIVLPKLLKALGVETIYKLFCEPTGNFPHNPEPLPENLTEISKTVIDNKADIGILLIPM
jgi:phosphomannomutase